MQIHGGSTGKAPEGRDVEVPPEWATFERSAKVWWDILHAANIDEHASMGLYLLGQLSDEGWYEANSIIEKVLRKVIMTTIKNH